MADAPPIASIQRYRDTNEMKQAFPATREHYQRDGVILLDDCGIDYDAEFIHRLTFPPDWKKIGTVNDITIPPVVWAQGGFKRTQNPLGQLIKEDAMLLKTYSEFLRLELGFKLLIMELFPGYRDVIWVNTTFRFTLTENEGPHVDVFNKGRPFTEEQRLPRLKFFLNVDSKPRVWNVGPTLRDVLKYSEGALGKSLPDDVNVVCDTINKSGVLEKFEYTRVEIPPRGIVFANGATVVHQVLYGQRMVALEALMARDNVESTEWDNLRDWILAAGYECHPPRYDDSQAAG